MVKLTVAAFVSLLFVVPIFAAPLQNGEEIEIRSSENIAAREPKIPVLGRRLPGSRLPSWPRSPGRRISGLPGFRIPKNSRTPGLRIPGLPGVRLSGRRRLTVRDVDDLTDVEAREPRIPIKRGGIRRGPGGGIFRNPRRFGRLRAGLRFPSPLAQEERRDVQDLLEREVELD